MSAFNYKQLSFIASTAAYYAELREGEPNGIIAAEVAAAAAAELNSPLIAALLHARSALREGHFNLCNSYDPDEDTDGFYSEGLRAVNKALGLDWQEEIG